MARQGINPLAYLLALLLLLAGPVPAAQTSVDARPFPRQFSSAGTAFTIYQPQVDTWQSGRLQGRFAMSVKTGTHTGADGRKSDALDYGVVWFGARTDTDKAANKVVLRDVVFDRANFPTASGQQDGYLELARNVLKVDTEFTVDLDQLQSALAFSAADLDAASHTVRNDAPEIVFAFGPALLILVDGEPSLKPGGAAGVERVVNSRSLLLRYDGRYYTRFAGHWASAETLAGAWAEAKSAAPALATAADQAVAAKQVDTLDKPPESLARSLAGGGFPEVLVRTHAAELIVIDGDPQFVAVPDTGLSYIGNTSANVFVDGAHDHAWYVLLSGRWFTGSGSKGPWTHVAPDKLPADFLKIPKDNEKSSVLASIAGTPEAREAVIANSIPQTATVHRSQAKLDVPYDGTPRFKAIEGTSLEYAWNTPVPVIRVAADRFYAVDKGIWFTATAATGAWSVATSVPDSIYAIPTTSPLHYVSYVRVYGGAGDEVYVGYTPGYYGTVVTDNVVVYGTGYPCTPWIGAYWYGCPATYGLGVVFGWDAWVGWTFGFGWGWYDPWYGPYGPWWGPWWGPAYAWGWWGGGAAAWNVYGHWGNSVISGIGAAWADPWSGNYGRGFRGGYFNEATGGRGVGRAAINTNAYTGVTRAGAEGIRYNPQTGRVVAGEHGVAVNPYTGRAAAGGERTVVNTETGRVTHSQGGQVVGPQGAAGAGSFDSDGRRVDAKGAGTYHYNADTGQFHHGGVIDVNDHVYAGHDGHVYKYDGSGNWEPVQGKGGGSNISGQTRDDLELQRNMREGGSHARGAGESAGTQRPAGGFERRAGGFRSGMGTPRMGGGFRRR